jgi:hypothetical protein
MFEKKYLFTALRTLAYQDYAEEIITYLTKACFNSREFYT